MAPSTKRPEQYFATLEAPQIAEQVMERVERSDRFVCDCGLVALWCMVRDRYYRSLRKADIENVGERGEFTVVYVNQYRNILRHLYVQATSARPAPQPECINDDAESRAQIEVCDSMLDYYRTERKLEQKFSRSTEGALIAGEWFGSETWDATQGEVVSVDPKSGQPVQAGDVRAETHHPADVIRDWTRESWDAQQWIVLRTYRNRYDLMLRHPEIAEQILALPSKTEEMRTRQVEPLLKQWNDQESDEVPVYTLYHLRTPSVPHGRIVSVLSAELVIENDTLDRRGLESWPVCRITAGEVDGLPLGYTPAYDLLAPQRWRTILDTVIATNQAKHGVANYQTEAGNNVTPSALGEGSTLFENSKPGAKIEPLDLLSSQNELFENREKIDSDMEVIAGVNSVARGQPEANLKSGKALALVQAQFVEFLRDFQASYSEYVGDMYTLLVILFQKHAEHPRFAAITGEADRRKLKKLSREDVSQIRRVKVDMGSFLSRTPAGRINLASEWLAAGLIKTPDEVLEVQETGRLEPASRAPLSEARLIKHENEQLSRGTPQLVIATQNHPKHILDHTECLNDPELLKDGRAVETLLDHIAEHERVMQDVALTRPVLAAVIGLPPALGGMPPASGAPGAPPPAVAGDPQAGPQPLPVADAAGQPTSVSMPPNPMLEGDLAA